MPSLMKIAMDDELSSPAAPAVQQFPTGHDPGRVAVMTYFQVSTVGLVLDLKG